MDTLARYKNWLIILAVIVLGVGAYFFFFAGDEGGSAENGALLTSERVSGASAEQSELVALLLKLRSIELNDDIFNDPAFNRLESFSQDIAPQPTGRENPFAPL